MPHASASFARTVSTSPDELAPRFAVAERRLTARALDGWRQCPDQPVPGHDANSLMIVDPGGRAWLESIGPALATLVPLAPGQRVERAPGLIGELAAVCDLIAMQPMPVTFEANLATPAGQGVMLRGIALPIARRGQPVTRAQIICSWREILNRAATARLRRELGEALRMHRDTERPEPFPRRG